jgi:hypothetical protein
LFCRWYALNNMNTGRQNHACVKVRQVLPFAASLRVLAGQSKWPPWHDCIRWIILG